MRKVLLIVLVAVLYATGNATAQTPAGLPTIEHARGTGRSTGHIADLIVRNDLPQAVRIPDDVFYIPADSAFQGYIGRLPENLALPPESRMHIPVYGFCTDVHVPPVPQGRDLPPSAGWIPVRSADSLFLHTFPELRSFSPTPTDLASGDTLIPSNAGELPTEHPLLSSAYVDMFSPASLVELLQSPGYAVRSESSDSLLITWPGTTLAVQGTLQAGRDPTGFARLAVTVLARLEAQCRLAQQAGGLVTPYAADSRQEREAVIQHALWIYAAALSGKPYVRSLFSGKLMASAAEEMGRKPELWSPAEKSEIEAGIRSFWSAFVRTGTTAQLWSVVELPGSAPQDDAITTTTPDTLQAPWASLDLCTERMKPFYAPPVVPVLSKGTSPWLPLFIGVANGALLIYLAGQDKEDPAGCDFSATADVTPASCGESNGAIRIMTDAVDVTYTWSDGAATAERTQLSAGEYTVTITRSDTTCTRVLAITVPDEAITFTVSLVTTDPDCGRANGAIGGNADPPGDYTWSWSTGATTPEISELPAGTYTVTVSAGGNCTQTQSATLQDKPFDPSIQVSVTPADCGLTNGTAAVAVDPPGTYDYTWSNGLNGAQVNDLAPGNYVVTVAIPGTSCAQTTDVTIDASDASFTLSSTSTPAACGQADGTATVTVDPPGAYDFLWSDGQATAQANGLAAGEYTVTVTVQGTTCSKNMSVTVDALPPAFTLAASATGTPCGLAEGTASVTVDSPGDYTYAWSDGQSTPTITGLISGAYTVTVTLTGTTCAKEITVTVDELPPVFTAAFDVTPADCQASNGGAAITIDPPGAYGYQWSNGAAGPVNTGLMAGSYTVTVTLAGTECSNAFTVVVEQAGIAFTASITAVNADCGVANGSANAITDPPGEYAYTWSNQQTGPLLQDVLAGTYSVDIADTNGCILTLEAVISGNPPVYVIPGEITPGNCLGGGEVIITLVTPGGGPIELQITTPAGGMVNTSIPPGTLPMSSLTEVTGGLYVIQAFDQQIGPGCTQTLEISVPDNTPPLIALDDTYETTAGTSVEANVLDNDSGLDPQVTTISEIIGGTVVFDAEGDFTFTPEPGFSGDGGFIYTVTDACGSIATARVIIVVQAGVCDFTADFAVLPATCGLPDGMITVTVDPPGNYLFSWSNGATGPSIHDVPGGDYAVTITDQSLGCDLSFETILPENPPNNIEAPAVEQPSCSGPGEISFLAQTPSGNSLDMTITHPGGTSVFVIEPGQVILSAFVPMAPGPYVVEVMDVAAGAACVETFATDLMPWQMINIVAETIIPPSTPSAMDGEVVVVAVTEGALPYTILLNDLPYGTANDHVFTVEGLGVGEHIIQVIDAEGCPSNQLFVVVPPPDIVLGLTAGWQTGPVFIGQPEGPTYAGQALGVVLGASLTKWYDHWGQEINVTVMPAVSRNNDGSISDLLQAEFLFKPLPWQRRAFACSVKGGPAIRHAPGTSLVEPFLLVRAEGTVRPIKGVAVSAFLGAEAGLHFLRPSAGVQVNLPLRFPRFPAGMGPVYSPLDTSPFER